MSALRYPSGLFVGGLILRLVVVLLLGDTAHPEMYEYGVIARHLLDGHGFAMHWPYRPLDLERQEFFAQPPAFESARMPPVYIYHIYFVFLALGDTAIAALTLMLFSSLYGALTGVMIYLIAREITGEKTARLSGLFAMIFPPASYAVITFSGSSLYHLTLCVVLYSFVRILKEWSTRWIVIAGAACAALTLQRSEFLGASLLLFGYTGVVACRKFKTPRILISCIGGLVVCLLLIAPWTWRNYRLFGEFVPVISRPWHEVWKGNNPYATGGPFLEDGDQIWVDDRLRFEKLIRRMDVVPYAPKMELDIDRILKEEVVRFVREHPGQAVLLTLKKWLMLWTFDPYYPPSRNPIFFLSILAAGILFWIGFLRFRTISGDYRLAGLWMIYIGFYMAVFGVTFILPRYQTYFMTGLLPFIGPGWQTVADWLRIRMIRP